MSDNIMALTDLYFRIRNFETDSHNYYVATNAYDINLKGTRMSPVLSLRLMYSADQIFYIKDNQVVYLKHRETGVNGVVEITDQMKKELLMIKLSAENISNAKRFV